MITARGLLRAASNPTCLWSLQALVSTLPPAFLEPKLIAVVHLFPTHSPVTSIGECRSPHPCPHCSPPDVFRPGDPLVTGAAEGSGFPLILCGFAGRCLYHHRRMSFYPILFPRGLVCSSKQSTSADDCAISQLEISPLYVHGSAERLIGELQRLPTNDKFGMVCPATKRMSTHTGNNLIIYCVGGNASLLAVPGIHQTHIRDR
ncbi:hypothetical protein HD554DRAFT_2042782 [Boletus coccyginus]|nr:hypothetical protein HD554DRAFT_2042782 [Boletus coccyginus]